MAKQKRADPTKVVVDEKGSDAAAASQSKLALSGKRVAFFGKFDYWPKCHNGTCATVAKRHGASVVKRVDDDLDILVLGARRGTGRADAIKKAASIRKRQHKLGVSEDQQLQVIDESAYRDLVRIEVQGQAFSFCGGFDCCPGEMHDMLHGMVEAAGARCQETVDASVDYLVVGNRRGKGKAAAIKEAEAAQAQGSQLRLIDETEFLELVRVEGASAETEDGGTMTFPSFVSNLYGAADNRKVQRALKMLQKDRFQLYSKVTLERVAGVVRSQTSEGSVYSPWIEANGKYGCSDPDLSDCMGLQGSVCKHLIVLLLGLVKAGDVDAKTACEWLSHTSSKRPTSGGEAAAEIFLQYRGVEAGEVDWRPTETIPEDFYSL